MSLVWKDSLGAPVTPAKLHEVEWDFLDRCYAKKVPAVILAPAGTGKTEGGLGFVLRLLSRDPSLRGQIVCDKEEHGQDRLAAIRHYIETDPTYRQLFPDVKVDTSRRGRRTIAKFRLTANQHAKDPSLAAAGVTSSGTGGRKDFIFFDDVCTEKNTILDPAQRSRVKAAFYGTWLTRIEPDVGWWFLIATLYHSDDLTHTLMQAALSEEAPMRLAVMRVALSEDFKCYDVEETWPGEETQRYTLPLWEPKWDEAAYRRRHAEMVAIGDESKFLAAYRNLVIDPKTATFPYTCFNRPVAYQPVKDYRHRVLYADTATSHASRTSDFYAGVVLGWDERHNHAVVLHSWYEKSPLASRVDRYLAAVEEFQPHRCAMEGVYELSFVQRVEEVALERGIGLKIVKVNQRVDKDARIGSLAPLLQGGKILVDLDRWPWFWQEARTWPRSSHDDALDALEGAWRQLKLLLRVTGQRTTLFSLESQRALSTIHDEQRYRFGSMPPREAIEERIFGL